MKARPLWMRRGLQMTMIALFIVSSRFGGKVGGAAVLAGDLSASRILGMVPLADPLAALQIFATGRLPGPDVLWGAALVMAIYSVIGGRVFCAWVCPVNIVSDAAGWAHRRLGMRRGATIPRSTRWWVLGGSLVISAVMGLSAFEFVSPVGMVQRGLVFGGRAAAVAMGGIFLAEFLQLPGLWCSRLCPLGAFYSLVGRRAAWKIRYDPLSCTHCGECKVVCPEPQVLDLGAAALTGRVDSSDCTQCGRCTELCPEGSLMYAWRPPSVAAVSKEKS